MKGPGSMHAPPESRSPKTDRCAHGVDMRDITSYARDLLFCLLLPFTAWCVFIPQPVARADGGAPNLAYIAGTPAGVSVIDVQRQRISRTLHVGGDPQDILLSLDGSLLYATQPAQERMAVINAQTGAMVCTAPVPFHPSLLTQTPSGDMLFVGSGTAVRAIDPHTCVVTHLFQVHTEVAGLTTSFFPGAFPNAGTTYQLWVASGHTLPSCRTPYPEVWANPLHRCRFGGGWQLLCS